MKRQLHPSALSLDSMRRIAPKAADRVKERIWEQTSRTKGVSIDRMAGDLFRYLRVWIGYFEKSQTPSALQGFEAWTRRRLRSAIWKQWKRGLVPMTELRKRNVGKNLTGQTAASANGPWTLANSVALTVALSNARFDSLGIPRLTVRWSLNPPNRRTRDPYVQWWGEGLREVNPWAETRG